MRGRFSWVVAVVLAPPGAVIWGGCSSGNVLIGADNAGGDGGGDMGVDGSLEASADGAEAGGGSCGNGVPCPSGEVCCDVQSAQGVCSPACVTGQVCPLTPCQALVPCGGAVCGSGELCCQDVSCNLACLAASACPIYGRPCPTDGGADDAGAVCGMTVCQSGQVCCTGGPFKTPTCIQGQVCPL
jgi:hypothetical protein